MRACEAMVSMYAPTGLPVLWLIACQRDDSRVRSDPGEGPIKG